MAGSNIAILIPCYNSANYLEELFEGIKAQTVPFTEVICYDDCSKDNTIEVAKRLGATVIEGKENRGPAFGRNQMIAACTTDYIHFHDSDDLIDPRFVEEMQKYIEDENVQLLCNTYVFDRETRKVNQGNITYDRLKNWPDQLDFFLNNIGFASMGVYSRKALNSIGGFRNDIKGNEDPDLHVRLSMKGYKIKPVKEYLVTKLEHEASFSHQNWFQCMADKLKCLQHYAGMLDKNYLPTVAAQAAELSNFFYREGDKKLSREARQLAFALGVKPIESSKFAKLVTSVFGVSFYLWIYRRRVDFNLI